MRRDRRAAARALIAAAAVLLASACASVPAPPAPGADATWVGAWASSQQIPEDRNILPDADVTDVTMRQIVRLSRGGARLRVRLSNLHGTAPLRIESAHLARAVAPGDARIEADSDVALTFDGVPVVVIPEGAEYVSDPIAYPTQAFEHLAVTFRLVDPPARQTSHPGSRTTTFYVHGDHVADADLPDAATIEHWYQLAAIDVTAPAGARAVVILGDSITDGRGSTTNGDDRWPDFLMARLQANPATREVGVLNHGVGGNRVLDYGLGPAALARFDRDVLTQTGVRYLIILNGINDIGTFMAAGGGSAEDHAALVRRLIGAYAQMIDRAHAQGIKVYGATIMPYNGFDYYPWTPRSEATRNAVNAWIRTSGRFDAVLDFDAAVRDPEHPDRLAAAYDTGDHLHVSPVGFAAMAESIPLELFVE